MGSLGIAMGSLGRNSGSLGIAMRSPAFWHRSKWVKGSVAEREEPKASRCLWLWLVGGWWPRHRCRRGRRRCRRRCRACGWVRQCPDCCSVDVRLCCRRTGLLDCFPLGHEHGLCHSGWRPSWRRLHRSERRLLHGWHRSERRLLHGWRRRRRLAGRTGRYGVHSRQRRGQRK